LFIRTTTGVNHYTYQFARRASAEGLVVIDDPVSITRCANKVYFAEQMALHGIPTPKTVILHRSNADEVERVLDFPLVLKQPDSQFSLGVRKVTNKQELRKQLEDLFRISDLVVAQEFVKTEFDWRVTVLDKQPLFVCRYFMAPNHWQIIRQEEKGDDRYGEFDVIPLPQAPAKVVKTAMRAANLMGNGLYGVDLKEKSGKVFVMEVNDNPNIDFGIEDKGLGRDLYVRIMKVFLDRIERRKGGNGNAVSV
jgi:glutathione synthase/RimK-type ligase-like ATP-grasp enzyme